MKFGLDEGRPWWRSASMKVGLDEGWPWWRSALMKVGLNEGQPWWRLATMKVGLTVRPEKRWMILKPDQGRKRIEIRHGLRRGHVRRRPVRHPCVGSERTEVEEQRRSVQDETEQVNYDCKVCGAIIRSPVSNVIKLFAAVSYAFS